MNPDMLRALYDNLGGRPEPQQNYGAFPIPLDLMPEVVRLTTGLDTTDQAAKRRAHRRLWRFVYDAIPAIRGWVAKIEPSHALQWRLVKVEPKVPPRIGALHGDHEIVDLWQLTEEQEDEFIALRDELSDGSYPAEVDTYHEWRLLQTFLPDVVNPEATDLAIVTMRDVGERGVYVVRLERSDT